MQHQFWITKKTVQRKLGSKEDEHIISSDAELDAKIEVFKSISETSADLCKIIDQYQERLCILSQEESVFGRFMKEAGKRSKTTGVTIANTGKAVSYCGQQRMCVRVPLLRLHHEVDVFRNRAVTDTQITITAMEKERTEYRAALEWMKSASSELDPDTGRGLDKFRTSQSHVRVAKQNFDSLSMDSIQKIDLLAAARCNMFSHVLVSYMSELRQFAQKTTSTFEAISKALEHKPKYDFCVLKELTQHEGSQQSSDENNKISSLDGDQSLFFAEDFVDISPSNENVGKTGEENHFEELSNGSLVELCNIHENDDIMELYTKKDNDFINIIEQQNSCDSGRAAESTNVLNLTHSEVLPLQIQKDSTAVNAKENDAKRKSKNKKISKSNPWIELFADLDPLVNLEAFDLKLSGDRKNFQQT